MTDVLDRLKNAIGSARRRLASVWRIARWEAKRSVGTIDRRTAAFGAIIIVLTAAVVGSVAVAGSAGLAIDRDIYRVGVDADNPYYPVVAESSQLAPAEPNQEALATGDLDVLINHPGEDVVTWYVAETEKGSAAHSTLVTSIDRYNERRMADEPNESAAYPVRVDLQYVSRQSDATTPGGSDDGTQSDRAAEGGSADTAEGTDTSDSSGDGTAGAASDEDRSTDDSTGGSIPSIGGQAFGGSQSGSPATIQPPFPFGSLLLAFIFLVPMNFVIQAYGGTMLNERINRRGELLLVAPLARTTIIAGKTLPYLLAAIVLTAIIAAVVGGGLLSVLAVIPIALGFLSATFVAAMIARSFKELTFVTVTIAVLVTTYAFVPAIFTNVTPIALISPLSIVVMDLQGEAVSIGEYLFSTGPFYAGSAVLFVLGSGIYREEDMFTQKPIPAKVIDALNAQLSGYASVGLWTALFVPFVFTAELLAIAILYVAPIELSIPVLLVTIALIEELAKSVHVYAGYARSRFERRLPVTVGLGIVSGVGFFLAEKFTAIAQVVGLPELAIGQAAFAPTGLTPTLAVGLLAAPLVLHTVTATITAVGARDGRLVYASALVIATIVHAAYNYGVVMLYA
ncbi:ABC transporter permease [Halalkalirubrum salinum]|uniref:ABC transporter permease n=1 Tax=Halalkalirubrum salinum TaxID=2563889 RepID=UPI0014853F0C|nr:ABC transporter permease subunit [Halalkalirubrum salinum]